MFPLATKCLALVLLACTTTRVQVPATVPPVSLQSKLPLRLALVVPDELRTRECMFKNSLGDTWIFDCGLSLYHAARATMNLVFADVESVSDLARTTHPWDRALWLEVGDFSVLGPSFTKSGRARVDLRLRATDRSGSETYSSEIRVEQEARVPTDRSLPVSAIRFAGDGHSAQPGDLQLAQVAVGPGPQIWGKEAISQAIQRVLRQMVDEIVSAYGSGRF